MLRPKQCVSRHFNNWVAPFDLCHISAAITRFFTQKNLLFAPKSICTFKYCTLTYMSAGLHLCRSSIWSCFTNHCTHYILIPYPLAFIQHYKATYRGDFPGHSKPGPQGPRGTLGGIPVPVQARWRLPTAMPHITVPLPAGLAHVVCCLPGEILV